MGAFMQTELWAWVVMPLLIFLARATDVSLATLRVMFVMRGFKRYAPLIGFFEAFIWILAVGSLIRKIDNPICYVAYAGGFSMGTFLGLKIDGFLGLGTILLRVITNQDPQALVEEMRQHNWGMTVMDGHGYTGNAYLLLCVIKRKDLEQALDTVRKVLPNAFYTTEDVKIVAGNVFK